MLKLIDRLAESALVALLLAMVVIGGLQVFNRFVLNMSLSWSEELQRYAHIWLVFLAIPVAYRRCAHIGMNMLVERFALPVQSALRLACELLWLGFGLCVAYYAMVIMGVARNQISSGLGITMDWVYLGQVVGSAYLVICVARNLAQGNWRVAGRTP
jgi:TRAP-type C4-dicarboxylate transport system permease small subunit